MQVLEYLRKADIPANGKLPPLRELSSQFNVSLATLRRAVVNLEKSGEVSIRHGSGVYVADKHGELVIETTILQPAPKNKTVYIIDSFAKGDIEGHYLDNYIIAETIQGAKDICLEEKWGLKVLSFVIGEGEHAILRRLEQDNENMALIVVTQHFLNLYDNVERLEIPTVSIGPLGPKSLKYEISMDLFEAGALAGEYLARLGHKDVLYIGQFPSVAKTSYLRHAGFCYAHQKAFPQGKINEVFIADAQSSSEEKQFYRDAAQQSLKFIDSVSAIFVSSEQIALTAVPYLLQNGVQIPQTVSLVTLDNSRFGKVFTPMWTSVDLNLQGAAKAAAELLLAWDSGLPKPAFYNSLVPSKLIVRDSAIAHHLTEKE
jgi:DNA-binding LacI/PurR family transcriptional regulator